MKRYLLFTTHDYYPQGGWGDFRLAGDSIEELKEAHTKLDTYERGDSAHIVDLETLDYATCSPYANGEWQEPFRNKSNG